MSFLKAAFVAFLAITAGGFAHARPVAPGGCGIGNPYDPQCAPSCGALGSLKHQCCAYKILHGFEDASCIAPAPTPAVAPPGSTCASTGPSNIKACCARKSSEGVADPTCPAPSPSPPSPTPSPPRPSPSPLPPSPSPLPPSPSPLPPSPSPSPLPPSPSPTPAVGADCGSRGPGYNAACCAEKASKGIRDPTCRAPSPPPPPPSPVPAVGADCGSRGPAYVMACCAEKASRNVVDQTCPFAPGPDPACPCQAPPLPDVNLTNLTATSAKGQFTFPDGAWKNIESFTVVPGLEFVGCDGRVVTRNGSESLEDCQRFATSLRFAKALTWDEKTETCQPYESLSGVDGAAADAPVVYAWNIDLVPANATIPAACAWNATVFTIPIFSH